MDGPPWVLGDDVGESRLFFGFDFFVLLDEDCDIDLANQAKT